MDHLLTKMTISVESMQMKQYDYDLFISHASPDKDDYIIPIADQCSKANISCWLDTFNVSWGDSITLRINEGLRTSRFVLLCMSKAFLGRHWPEKELGAAISLEAQSGGKRVLPLILNSKEEVLQQYPILGDSAYKSFDAGIEPIILEIKQLLSAPFEVLYDDFIVLDSNRANDFILLANHYGKRGDVLKYIDTVFRTREDPGERQWGYWVLSEIGGKSALQIVKKNIGSENEFVEHAAQKALLKLSQ